MTLFRNIVFCRTLFTAMLAIGLLPIRLLGQSSLQDPFEILLDKLNHLKSIKKDSLRLMVERAKAELPTVKTPTQQIRANLLLGNAYQSAFFGPDSAAIFYEKARELEQKYPDPKLRVELLHRSAMNFYGRSLFETAIGYATDCIELSKQLGDKEHEARCLGCMSIIMASGEVGEAQKSLDYAMQELAVRQSMKDTAAITHSYMTIALSHSQMGNNTEALRYIGLAEKSIPFIDNKFDQAEILFQKGNMLSNAQQWRESLVYFEKALPRFLALKEHWRIMHTLLAFASVYNKLGQPDKAIVPGKRALMINEENPELFVKVGGYYELYKAYKMKGMADSSLYYHELYFLANDSIRQTNRDRAITEMEERFQNKEKGRQIEEQAATLQQERRNRQLIIGMLAVAVAALAFIVFALVRVRKARRQLADQNLTISQQAEELKSLEQLKSRFFANVSHELRTPLTLMLGPINSLLKRKTDGDEETKLLQFIQRNTQKLQQLINEILDLSKLEDNKLEVVEEAVVLRPYLNNFMAQFNSASASHQLGFGFIYEADDSLQIMLDKNKFEKIVNNFFSNAIKFTPKGGQIVLSVKEEGQDLELSVADNGRGIHPNDLPHVFDRFYQSKQVDTPTEGGTGIGLSLVKELAELLGGQVWAESEHGRGSVFYFRFPKKEADGFTNDDLRITTEETALTHLKPQESQGETHAARIANRQSSIVNTATILIVEDNHDLREYLHFLLSDYNVLTAENGQAALDLLNGEQRMENAELSNSPFTVHHSPFKIDLIISDLMMPVMDGFQFLEKLKSDDRWRHLPVIMLTAKVNVRAKLKALRIGVDDYLTKPFEEEELKARIGNLLRNFRERMEMFSLNRQEILEPIEVNQPVIAAVDAEWLQQVEAVFNSHLTDSRLSVDFAAGKLNISERQFHRRIKELTGLTPNQYLQEIRLQRAKDLLVEGKFATVKEVVYAVGFQDVRYFSELFEKHFGVKPSGIRK